MALAILLIAWGVPAEDDTLTREERENAPPRYREPGKIPEAR